MGANRSKLLDGVRSNVRHKLTELSIDDLLDERVLQKEFTDRNFREFLREDLVEEEEEEASLLRYLELFKRDMLLNFTDSSIGKDIPNMSTNHVYDRFTGEYNNSHHNEFTSRIAKTTNFLLTIFLNLAKTETEKEEVLNLLAKLQKDLSNDSYAQQKFFSVFSIINNLKKMINIEKNYEEFFNMLNSYTKFLNEFVRDSKFTIYLIKDLVTELSESIITNVINNNSLDSSLRKKGIVALLKMSVCFKIVDLHILFIENLLKNDFSYEIKEDLVKLLQEVFESSTGLNWSTLKPSHHFKVRYNQEIEYEKISSYATDGTFIYIHHPKNGLYKMGTGLNNTIEGKIYAQLADFYLEAEGSLVFSCGRLYFRAPQTAPFPFVEVDPNTLTKNVELPSSFKEDASKTHFFVDNEKVPANLTYTVEGHSLIDSSRSDAKSRMISDGRFLYIVSIVGGLKCNEKSYKGIYPKETLISVDVYDPLDNCNFVTSFPIKDNNHILGDKESSFTDEAMIRSINTDGRVIQFLTKNPVTFNMITGTITEVDATEGEELSIKFLFDLHNSCVWSFADEDSTLSVGYCSTPQLNVNPNTFRGSYESMPSHTPFKLLESINSIYDIKNDMQEARKDKEESVYDFFFKEKKNVSPQIQNETQSKEDKYAIVSVLLNTLADGAEFSLTYSSLNTSNVLSHVFSPHLLNLNAGTLERLVKLQKTFMDSFVKESKHEYETKYFIISALFKLIAANLRQIQFLKFDKFTHFTQDFGYLREFIQDAIFLTSEFNLRGEHFNGLSIDLLAKSFEIVEQFSGLFAIEYPDFNTFMDLLPKTHPNLVDFKRVVLNSITKSGKKIYSALNIDNIASSLETLMKRNDATLFSVIDRYVEVISTNEDDKVAEVEKKLNSLEVRTEYEQQYESLFTPLLKLLFNSYMEISSGKDDAEKAERSEAFYSLLGTFERLFTLLCNHMTALLNTVDSKISGTKLTTVDLYNTLTSRIASLLKSSSYTFRFFYSSAALLNILIKDNKVIFLTWHYFYDLLLQFDKSCQSNGKLFLELEKNSNKENATPVEPFDLVIETSHPAKKLEVEKTFKFSGFADLFVYFDPLSYKSGDTKFVVSYKNKQGDELEEVFNNGFINKSFRDVDSFNVKLKTEASEEYGVKVHIQNHPKFIHYFKGLQTLNTSIIINSLKTFFFFNYSKSDGSGKEVEEMLQSKLFEGGINELLDLEISSEHYKTFMSTLKRSSSFDNFEKRLSQNNDEFNESELPPFDIDEFIFKENISVEKLITYFQKSLRPRFPWINIGGENADKIVRATFAVLVKQENLYEMITEVVNKICDLEENKQGEDYPLTIKELGEIDNFEYLLLTWTEISRLRQWYQEQVKDLAEANSDDFDKQNENFVESVVEKCRFLFTINAPKRKALIKKGTKLNFLNIFAKSQLLSACKIGNDIVKANVIKFKKNLMQGKIEEKGEIDHLKRFIQSITNCVKMTKVTIESLKTAMREMNTRAKFREIALSLINSLLIEVDCPDTKLFIMKQIIQTLRKTSGKKLVSIDDEVKSASPDLLTKIQTKFHSFIQIVFANLLKSKSIFYISEFMECLLWNLRARNQKILIEVNFFENMFINSPNDIIRNIWNKISQLKMNPYKKNNNIYKFTEKSLGFQLLEFFHIYASMIAGRVIDETHSADAQEQQPQTGFLKKKSSVFDNSFDRLIENICFIIAEKLKEYMKNYNDLNENLAKYNEFLQTGKQEEQFATKYFDEGFLNIFLLLVYKFNINQSNLIMKHMKEPEFIVSLLVLVKYTSNKNKYSLVNILKVYLTLLNEEDLHNVVFFLKKNDFFKARKYIGLENILTAEAVNPRRVIVLYLLNVVFELRQGLFTKKITFSNEYEESVYIVNLLRSLYSEEKWRATFDEVFLEELTSLNVQSLNEDSGYELKLVSPILSVLNGDCEDLHYGAFVYIKYKGNPKSIVQMFKEKMEEINHCTSGYIIGFAEKEVNLNDMQKDKDVKDFLSTELHYNRRPTDKFALIISINKEMYEKNKLKNNDVEFQMKELHDIIISPAVEARINNPQIVNVLLSKENELLQVTQDESIRPKLGVSYLHVQMLKTINTLFKPDNEISADTAEFIKKNFSLDRLRPLISKLTRETYHSIKANQYDVMNYIKLFLNSKTELKMDFNDRVTVERTPVKCSYLRVARSMKIYKNDVTYGKVFKIVFSNCAIDSNSFQKISNFRVVALGDKRYPNYLNSLVFCRYSEEAAEKINKIDDINFALMFCKKDLKEHDIKTKVPQRFIIIDAEYEEVENLLNDLENDTFDKSTTPIKLLEKVDYEKLKLKPEDVEKSRTKAVDSEAEGAESITIKYSDPVESNFREIVTGNMKRINELNKTLKAKNLDDVLQKLVKNYLRYFLVHILSLIPQLITKETYSFLAEQFKIVYYDACQYSSLTTFNYSRFNFVNNLMIQLLEKEVEFGVKLLTVETNTKMFNAFTEIIEENFSKNVQSELVELYFENELSMLASTQITREKYSEFLPKILKLALITLNYETFAFNQYLSKAKELLEKLYESVDANSPIETLNAEVQKMKKEGIDALVKYLIQSFEKEKIFTSRTKLLFSFVWEYSKLVRDTYKRVYNEDRTYALDEIPKSAKLVGFLNEVNILFYKSKEKELRNQSLFSLEDIKKKLTTSNEIPVSPYVIEKILDHKLVKRYDLTPKNPESRGKMLIQAEKTSQGTYKINDMVGDDEALKLRITPTDHLLVVNKDQITSEMWMCGYNERHKLGVEALNDYQYCYVPMQCNIDADIRIRKVVNGCQCAIVATYDNKIYVAGEGVNSGLESLSKVFTIANKWNDILKKGEKFVDMSHNETSAFVLVTDKNVYVSGYNNYCYFANLAGSSCNLTGILKLPTPFKVSKVLEVSLGYAHCLYRLDDGSVYGIGCNSCYELNLDSCSQISTLTKLNMNGLKCEIASAGYHSSLFLLKEKGSTKLYSCGSYDYGQNGQGSSNDKRLKKCLGTEDLEFRFAKMGYYCSCAVTSDNKLYTWGYNGYYNLAHEDTSYRYQPKLVEFFSGMSVVEVDINERNMVVICNDSIGQSKVYTAGYNGYACMGIGESIASYNNIPLEVTTFSGSYVQKVSLSGYAYQTCFIKCNVNAVSNPFQFKCSVCSEVNNDTLYILRKSEGNQKVCHQCLTDVKIESELANAVRNVNVTVAIRNISLGTAIDTIALPDLTIVNEVSSSLSKEKHSIQCTDCCKLISEDRAYIVADELQNERLVAFCEICYLKTAYFEVPKFVYCVKNAIDYQNLLPKIDSYALLKYDTKAKLTLSEFSHLNEEGLKEFRVDHRDIIEGMNKSFDEIRSEHLVEYLKITDGEEKEKKVLLEEIKKIPLLEKMTASQIDIIELLCNKIENSMKTVKDFVDMKFNNLVKEIYTANLTYLSKKSRNELFDKALYEGAIDVSPDAYYMRISRGKTIKFKTKNNVDYQGLYTIFGQVFKQLKTVPITQFTCKKNNRLFKCELVGEGAIDAGGPYREIMNIMCDELQSQWLDLFIPSPNNKFSAGQDREKWIINPAAKSATHLEMYTIIGKLFGFAIRSTGFMNLNLPSFVWKGLLDQPFEISDLERIDVHTANFLEDLMNLEAKGIDEEQFEYLYDQQYTTILSNGKEVELQNGGKDKKLTFANAKEYVNLALTARFEESKVQLEAIKAGLFEVIKKDMALVLSWKDLEERVCGNLIVDADWLKENTIYDSWSSTDQVVQWFWQAMSKFNNEERILYLKFVWGRSRLPLTKDSFTQNHKIARSYSNHPDISLPLSHTCFFTIDLPPYSSYDILYNKLLYAIRFCGEIDNDNNASQALEDL